MGRYSSKYKYRYTGPQANYNRPAVIFIIESIRRIGKVKFWSFFLLKVSLERLREGPIECLKHWTGKTALGSFYGISTKYLMNLFMLQSHNLIQFAPGLYEGNSMEEGLENNIHSTFRRWSGDGNLICPTTSK